MNDVVAFLDELRQFDISVGLDGGDLRFSAPRGALTPELRARLREHKAEIVRLLRISTELPQLQPAPDEAAEPFPLTDIQQAYWLGRSDAFELSDVSTHVYLELEARDLDVPRLEAAWNRLVAHHGMLRAIVLPSGDQRILPHAEVGHYVIATADLHGRPADAVASHLAGVRAEMSHQVFPADRWPLFELRATQLGAGMTRLHVSVDVLIVDGSSLTRLFRQWAELYETPDAALAPLEISFRDYVLAERALRRTPLYERSERYWMDRLDSLPPAPELPLRRGSVGGGAHHFERRSAVIDHRRWSRLSTTARRFGLTPSSLLLSVFAEVLARWSRSPRFTINVTLFNRLPLHRQVSELVGDFTSVTLLERGCDDGATFVERAIALQGQLLQDMDHRLLSGVRVLRELTRRSGRSGQALMPVVFTSGLALGGEGVGASALRPLGEVVFGINQTPQVWLDLQVLEQPDGLVLNWDAVEALFPAGVLDAMFAAYRAALDRLTDSDTSWRARTLDLLPEGHRSARARYNATTGPLTGELLDTGLHESVRSAPQRVAIATAERTITYARLEAASGRIADQLRGAGARPGDLVAVVIDVSWQQIAAVFGVLAVGAAYLPIPPDLPEARRMTLLQSSGSRFALCVPAEAARLQWPETVVVIEVTADGGSDDRRSPATAAEAHTPSALAYVIYTSGSTGQPKGVALDHTGPMNTIADISERYGVDRSDTLLGLSRLSFDLSVYDIFGIMRAGGTLVLPEAELRLDPAHWCALMRRFGVTIWNTVPALMELLLDYLDDGEQAPPPGLRLVLLSGDWIPVTLPARLRRRWPDARIVSLGGATEASIWSIAHSIDQVDPSWTSIPYGIPLRNQTWHVLDHALDPVPDHVTGELYIGGRGLALGYWQDRPRTDASFIVHPRTHERLYRTGDIGRFVPTSTQTSPSAPGYIELLGRDDLQVKVAGHRIELGEIEAALSAHEDVQHAAVVVRGERHGARQLVAYIVSRQPTGGVSASATGIGEAHAPPAGPGIVSEPAERIEFTLARHGLLPNPPDASGLRLQGPEPDRAVWLRRQSHRRFLADPVDAGALGRLLSSLRAVELPGAPMPKFRYPSAGGLYPVQVFVHVRPGRVAGVPPGTYYFHPDQHRLVRRPDRAAEPGLDAAGPANRVLLASCALVVLLVADLDAIEPLYGDRARDFCLIEAGYISQLLMEEVAGLGLGACPIGGWDPSELAASLELGRRREVIHGLLVGAVGHEQRQTWLAPPTVSHSESLAAELTTHLRTLLPEYMIPTTWIRLPALPMTANGKVDRSALPEPSATAAVVAPESPVQEAIAEIWAAVLGVSAPSASASFFELGGDSLMATRVVTAVRQSFGVEIPLRTLLQTPTIRGLADHVEACQLASSLLAGRGGSRESAEAHEEGEL